MKLMSGKWGRLTVLEFAGLRERTALWRCACECTTIRVVAGSELRRRKTLSCGCLQREKAAKTMKVNRLAARRRGGGRREESNEMLAAWTMRHVAALAAAGISFVDIQFA
jgi:hypothetical protein